LLKPSPNLKFLLLNEQGDTLIGQSEFNKITRNKYRISLTNLPEGWYYVNFFSGNTHFVKMFFYGKEP
jgi:hypothetical protein